MEHEMSNTALTADIIAKEAVMILENECVMAKLVHRGYEEEFSGQINGYTKGETVSIRRPTDFTVRDGATAVIQDVVEGKTTFTVDKQKGIDFKFTSQDLTLQIKDLSERVIKPGMIQLANQVDLDLMALYAKVPKHVTIPSGGIDSFADFALAPTLMDKCSIPQEGRNAVLNPTDHWALLGSQTALYMQDVAKSAYRSARVGNVAGIETYMSQNAPTHTTGTRTGTDLVNHAIVDGTFSWALNKDSTYIEIGIDGLASATATLTAGDTFTISDLYDVNPVTKATLAHLKQFVVMEAATGSGSAIAALRIWPAIILSGAHKTCHLSTGDIDNNTITYQGAASTNYQQNLFFHKNAFGLVMVPMVKPAGAVEVARRSYKGMSVRVIPYYDGTNDEANYRLDILYGTKCIDPRLAVRASLAADI
jgi:hypothetical protein